MFGKAWEFLTERFLHRDRDVPRVAMSLIQNEARVGGEAASQTTVVLHWTMKLVLTNESSVPAADLKVVRPRDGPLSLAKLPYHLNPYEEKVVLVRGETGVAREAAERAGPDDLFALLPKELREPDLVLTYRDVNGEYFHSRYSRSEGRETVEYLRNLPQT